MPMTTAEDAEHPNRLQVAFPAPDNPKPQLRKTLREMLRRESSSSAAICTKLEGWLADHPALRVIAVFAALPGEPDLADLVARHAERRWVYPRVDGEQLTFHMVTDPARELSPGAFGIREPSAAAANVAIPVIDAFFCPGLAFDGRGGRLGRGRGFYDRILALARPDAIKVGVCHARQLVDDTHSEDHDIHMDHVICA